MPVGARISNPRLAGRVLVNADRFVCPAGRDHRMVIHGWTNALVTYSYIVINEVYATGYPGLWDSVTKNRTTSMTKMRMRRADVGRKKAKKWQNLNQGADTLAEALVKKLAPGQQGQVSVYSSTFVAVNSSEPMGPFVADE